MKTTLNHVIIYFFILLFLLTGCAGEVAESANDAYDVAIQNGLKELTDKNFEKAAAYFEIALEEDAEDERASVLLKQTEDYLEAVDLFEQEKYEDAAEKAEAVRSINNGSEALVLKADDLLAEIESIKAEEKASEEKVKTEEEKAPSEAKAFESYKGIYGGFTGTPYESTIGSVFLLSDDTTLQGVRASEYITSDITGKSFQGDTLILDLHAIEQPGNSGGAHRQELTIVYDDNDYKFLQMKTGEQLYPITYDDFVASGFTIPFDSEDPLYGLKAYDKYVPRAVSRSNTEPLDDYSAKEIEYARVWLNTINNTGVAELNVQYQAAGTPINHYDEASAVYSEEVTIITGSATADGMIVYSGNGDGTINIYNTPSHWHAPPEEWPAIYADILATEALYLEPLDDEEVVSLIERMTIHK